MELQELNQLDPTFQFEVASGGWFTHAEMLDLEPAWLRSCFLVVDPSAKTIRISFTGRTISKPLTDLNSVKVAIEAFRRIKERFQGEEHLLALKTAIEEKARLEKEILRKNSEAYQVAAEIMKEELP